MPIYQYKCSECDHRLEALQKMSDDRLTDCPACQKPNLVKQITAAAFKLKGTGWYETDFKNSGAKPTTATSGDSAGSSENSVEKSADEKKADDKGGDGKSTVETRSANNSPSSDSTQSKSKNDSTKAVSTTVEA